MIIQQILTLINRSKKILIVPSPPDGDSIGSSIALYQVLNKIGKDVTVISDKTIPESLTFLPNLSAIEKKISSTKDFTITINPENGTKIDSVKAMDENGRMKIVIRTSDGIITKKDLSIESGKIDFDLILTVDLAELSQLGGFYEENISMFKEIPVINIDHHISNDYYGRVNYVDIMASSTTELLLTLFEEMQKTAEIDLIDEDIATLLLTGIVTDTGSFQNANTTPKSFATSAKLISYGARQQEIIQKIYKTKHLSQLRLWGRVLSKLQVDEEHRVVWSTIGTQDLKDTESTIDQIGDVVDELMSNAPRADIIALIKQQDEDIVSVSLRTTNNHIDANKIAEHFGGGGHTRAAGFRIEGKKLMDAEYKVINYIKQVQASRLQKLTKVMIKDYESDEVNGEKRVVSNSFDTNLVNDVSELMDKAKEAQNSVDELTITSEDIKKEEDTPFLKTIKKKVAKKSLKKNTENTSQLQKKAVKYKFEE